MASSLRFADQEFTVLTTIDENSPPLQPVQNKEGDLSIPSPLKIQPARASIQINSDKESLVTESASRTSFKEAVRRSSRQVLTLPSPLPAPILANARSKRFQAYGHVSARINTGLSRAHTAERKDKDTYQLGPLDRINWKQLQTLIEEDKKLCDTAQRIEVKANDTDKQRLKAFAANIRTEVKEIVHAMMHYMEQRYKIVIHVTVVEKTASGISHASMCLWNIATDNLITIKMRGVNCDIIIVVFLLYTDLGAIES